MAGEPDEGLLDFNYINRLPIVEVAAKLDLVESGKVRCWRSDKHQNGRTEYLSVRSNRVKCPACNAESMSVLEMVVDCAQAGDTEFSLIDAAEYIAQYFPVPRIAKGSHLKNPDRCMVPPACEDPLALLVVSGVWAELSESVQRLLPALLKLGELKEGSQEYWHKISFRAMMRYSGIKSPNAISAALDELERIGWLERHGSIRRGDSPIKATGQYLYTPLSQRVRELADATAQKFAKAITVEKQARKQERQKRERKLLNAKNQTT